MKSDAVGAVPALIRVTKDSNMNVRLAAISALGEIGRRADLSVPLLIRMLRASEWQSRRRTISALGQFRSKAAVPLLLQFLKSKHRDLRKESAKALGRISASPGQVVPALARALRDPKSEVRAAAAFGLSRFGSRASSAIPSLAKALGDPGWAVRRLSGVALGRIGAKSVPTLLKAIGSKDWRFRAGAAAGLAQKSIRPEVSVPALDQALRGERHQSAKRELKRALRMISWRLPPLAMAEARRYAKARRDGIPLPPKCRWDQTPLPKRSQKGSFELRVQLVFPKEVSFDEVAGFLRVSRPRLYRWLRMGKLPGVKIAGTWRIPESALTALLAPASNAAVDVQSIARANEAPMAVQRGER